MKLLINVSCVISGENQQVNTREEWTAVKLQALQVLISTVWHVQFITDYFAFGLIMFQSATGKNMSYDPFSGIRATARFTI